MAGIRAVSSRHPEGIRADTGVPRAVKIRRHAGPHWFECVVSGSVHYRGGRWRDDDARGVRLRCAGDRRRDRRPVDGVCDHAHRSGHPGHGPGEGVGPGPAPDRAQQRSDPQRHLLPPRLAQGPLRGARRRRNGRLLRRARHRPRGDRQADRRDRAVRAAPAARPGPARPTARTAGARAGPRPDHGVRAPGARPRRDPGRIDRGVRLRRGRGPVRRRGERGRMG